uniref:glutamate dehydrogenase (NADP(+)) n=1 Tax=Prasinoderma singulare TaxID=676789 RepID=A0A7S3FG62_9VIRI
MALAASRAAQVAASHPAARASRRRVARAAAPGDASKSDAFFKGTLSAGPSAFETRYNTATLGPDSGWDDTAEAQAVARVHLMANELYQRVAARNAGETEFLQAFREVLDTLMPLFERENKYLKVLEVIAEPERAHSFRVPWVDDHGKQQVNRGFRVQFSSALGPYKGGLRFHPTVNLSIIKFLGFEQIFKNSLTGLPIGGGKGGSDFDPKGKSDGEILRFCQSFCTSLSEYIGPNIDVPAGDIGVGGREIGYMYGQYKRLTRSFEGAFTGKDPKWGGSLIRPEATGYGTVYFLRRMVQVRGEELKDQRVLLSGAGNVAQYAAEKLLHEGAVPLTMSDSTGYVYAEGGFDEGLLQAVKHAKNVQRTGLRAAAAASGGRLQFCSQAANAMKPSTTATITGSHLHPHPSRPWGTCSADIALPCATQNELDLADAKALISAGVSMVVEGANMPCTAEAAEFLIAKGVAFGPAKAANAGGVAVSALEMTQNSMRLPWTSKQVDDKLQEIMARIFQDCARTAADYGAPNNLRLGANVAGFLNQGSQLGRRAGRGLARKVCWAGSTSKEADIV